MRGTFCKVYSLHQPLIGTCSFRTTVSVTESASFAIVDAAVEKSPHSGPLSGRHCNGDVGREGGKEENFSNAWKLQREAFVQVSASRRWFHGTSGRAQSRLCVRGRFGRGDGSAYPPRVPLKFERERERAFLWTKTVKIWQYVAFCTKTNLFGFQFYRFDFT